MGAGTEHSSGIADGIFAGPQVLPLLEVDEQLQFFSSNAAAQYLFPVLDLSENGQWYVYADIGKAIKEHIN